MTNAELIKVVDNQKDTIGRLTSRMGQLADDLAVLKGEVETFKGHVANDMKRVIETLQNK
tara:strand:+ start:4484 stop:4663 length:180 start_codon:yes stop_codon:yes gene_type:complete